MTININLPFYFELCQALTGTPTGALTYGFIQAAQNEPGTSYGRLLNAMYSALHQANSAALPYTNGSSQVSTLLLLYSNLSKFLSQKHYKFITCLYLERLKANSNKIIREKKSFKIRYCKG